MAKVIRSVKNVTKGYSSVQVKVRNGMSNPRVIHLSVDRLTLSALATSNDPWGPTGTEMTDIAQMTFNSYAIPLYLIAAIF
jgi:epsin